MFRPKVFPFILLIKNDKVYEYNNLKNIDIDIPRGKLIVVTGVSGSGKSSFAIDTLFAEAQRAPPKNHHEKSKTFSGLL
jgi:excinuclease ABC subunit A